MYRKYYSYSDMPQILPKREMESCKREDKSEISHKENTESGKLFGRFETDDVLLAVIIIALLLDESADNTLIIALAFVFLSGLL